MIADCQDACFATEITLSMRLGCEMEHLDKHGRGSNRSFFRFAIGIACTVESSIATQLRCQDFLVLSFERRRMC